MGLAIVVPASIPYFLKDETMHLCSFSQGERALTAVRILSLRMVHDLHSDLCEEIGVVVPISSCKGNPKVSTSGLLLVEGRERREKDSVGTFIRSA